MIVLLGMRNDVADQISDNAQVSLERLAESVSHQANRFLAPAEASIGVAKRLVADGFLDPSNNRQLESFFLAEIKGRESIKGLYVGRPDGSFLFVGRNEDGVLTKTIKIEGPNRSVMLTQRNPSLDYLRSWVDPQDQFSPLTRPWYATARASDALSWTGVYTFFSSRTPGISAAIAMTYPDGSDAGVIGVDVDIRDLSAYIAQVPTTDSGEAVLVDENLNVVGFSDLARLSAQLQGETLPGLAAVAGVPLNQLLKSSLANPSEPSELAASASAPVLTALTSPANKRLGSGLQSGFKRYQIDGQEYLCLVRPLSLSDGRMNWTLLVQMPAIEYFGLIDTLFANKLRSLLAVFAVTAIIAALGFFGLSDPQARARQDSSVDPLTGALTRSEFERRLQGMLNSRRVEESDARIYVVALDLDGFKQLNERFSDEVGDQVLTKFVKRLRRNMRSNDLVGRNGGDEFVLAVRFDRSVDVAETVERIRCDVVQEPFRCTNENHQIGVTAGIAGFDGEEALDSLISRANQALVTGKARGRNRCYMAPDHHARWPETAVSVISAQTAAQRYDPGSRIMSDNGYH